MKETCIVLYVFTGRVHTTIPDRRLRSGICYLCRMSRNLPGVQRRARRKLVCPEGHFTSRLWGHSTSWSMIGIFSTSTQQMEHTLPLVNYYRKRDSTGMPWLTTNGWQYSEYRILKAWCGMIKKISNVWNFTRARGVPSLAQRYCSPSNLP
jgi:hypothetical protein